MSRTMQTDLTVVLGSMNPEKLYNLLKILQGNVSYLQIQIWGKNPLSLIRYYRYESKYTNVY